MIGLAILVVRRVPYGKKSTPVEDREYKCLDLGTSAVGNRKDWQEAGKNLGFTAVEFVELDGSRERFQIK